MEVNNHYSNNVKENSKEDEMIFLRASEKYLNTIWPYASRITDYEDKIKGLQTDINNGISNFVKTGIISFIIALVFLFLAISNNPTSDDGFGGFFNSIGSFFSAVFTVVCVICAIIGIIAFISIKGRKTNIAKMKNEILELNNQIENTYNEINQIQQRDEMVYNRSCYGLLFPNHGVIPEDINLLISFMETGRANSFKEALNLLDEHKHRQKLENMTNQQLIYSRQTAISSAMAASAAAETAASARDRPEDCVNLLSSVE